MDNTQSAAELRRSWLRGVREADVDRALGDLERRNYELESQLADAQETAREFSVRVASAEETLQTFHASFEHVGTMLSMAEERARETERAAEVESMRLRSEAEERVRAAQAEIDALVRQKHETLEALGALRARLAALSEEVPAEEAELEPPPRRITVADLLAMEADGKL